MGTQQVNNMVEIFAKYLPEEAVNPCLELVRQHQLSFKVVKQRVTRHGDYKRLPDGRHQITVKSSGNPYRFLITLIHEMAHLLAFEKYGRKIKPHGREWKRTFQYLMLPFIRPEVFPAELLPLLARHFKNPKASSSTDMHLAMALKKYDPPTNKVFVLELAEGEVFRLYNGKRFQKGRKRVKRFECLELGTGRIYLFQPNAEVERIIQEL